MRVVALGPSYARDEDVMTMLLHVYGTLRVDTATASTTWRVQRFDFQELNALARFRVATSRLQMMVPIRIVEEGGGRSGHAVLLAEALVNESDIVWDDARLIFTSLVEHVFPASPRLNELFPLTSERPRSSGMLLNKACCYSSQCVVCRNNNVCPAGGCGIQCPLCVPNECNDCRDSPIYDPNCPWCDVG